MKVMLLLDIQQVVKYIFRSLDFYIFNTYLMYKFQLFAPVAQLDRALDSGSKGWGFDSLQAYLK